jgi:hypothetical protein
MWALWKNKGKPLISCHHHSDAVLPRIPMSRLIAQLTHFFAPAPAPAPANPAAALMERANLCAGFDACHAQELRFAASAWLRVVR